MAQITDHTTLQTELASLLMRSDMAADIPGLIQRAEASLRRDDRAKLLVTLDAFDVSSAETALPSDYDSLESIDHVGGTHFGPVETVPLNQLGEAMRRFGQTGVPAFAAVITDVAGNRLRWAPAPDGTYSLNVVYWAKIVPLSASNPTNRFLLAHPDIYLYSAAVESAPYLREDPRLQVWRAERELRLNELEASTNRALYSGTLSKRPGRVF